MNKYQFKRKDKSLVEVLAINLQKAREQVGMELMLHRVIEAKPQPEPVLYSQLLHESVCGVVDRYLATRDDDPLSAYFTAQVALVDLSRLFKSEFKLIQRRFGSALKKKGYRPAAVPAERSVNIEDVVAAKALPVPEPRSLDWFETLYQFCLDRRLSAPQACGLLGKTFARACK